ncbi:hypothetical protein HNP84_000566 [Thermocatellispora tengchongensis]|uniref:Uncharacterized protein n=1 Tax=Thermocatellispora tengchongensis TaxID=1073253 RepID=A0A840NTH1_9ACTN|nr:hypothetical protein [Thermocatellispora tengchongensis]MBB5130878.1 hypothetical protein [Thermocatellispora tengchongensis]
MIHEGGVHEGGVRGGGRDNAEHEANMALFRVVHEIATRFAGRPVPVVLAELRARVPAAPGLDGGELLRIAEEISVGRDPSGL